ncbi:peptide transporter [Mycobacterium sp. 1482292.6]|uniref:ParB/RepB/Spo0J family partition protein n=1 Tax=unclassified Mycobacterium TaxID=2642494 RepID=UPI0007FEC827|nr:MULTISPECIES: ParB/RepB/Spo0J family partition protein [unclassified Mycobacterium]OBJ12684.1 peptide transporter [Mycobacterium sp. 1482292.6]OBJ24486.1 peptide transporter [Mycobacterium sp. 1245801.1]
MARGQRTNLASLSSSVGDKSPVEQLTAMPSRTTPLTDLTPNPHNPRDDLGDLSDLESIADIQLQPAVVVTKSAYLKLYPDDVITARFVVINGCRRLAAAHKYGRTDLAVVINDDIARDRITLISASIAENVDRQDFDVIEEAKAVQALVSECGSAVDAATRLRKTQAWVSQRRALLALDPRLQTALRRGELAIREARTLARVPLEEQVARWQAAQERNAGPRPTSNPPDARDPSPSRVIARALRQFPAQPTLLADALRTQLGPDGVKTLLAVLTDEPAPV